MGHLGKSFGQRVRQPARLVHHDMRRVEQSRFERGGPAGHPRQLGTLEQGLGLSKTHLKACRGGEFVVGMGGLGRQPPPRSASTKALGWRHAWRRPP